MRKSSVKKATKEVVTKKAEDKNAKKLEIIQTYVNIIKSGTMLPSRQALYKAGVSRDMVRHYFVNLTELRKTVKLMYPKLFDGHIDLDEYLSDKNFKKIDSRIRKSKLYFITTAVSGQATDVRCLRSVRQFCKREGAKLIVLPSHDPAHNLDTGQDTESGSGIEWVFDNAIRHEDFIFDEYRLNSNLFISGIRVTAKQINPITGLSELSQKKGSCIFASPKQALEYDAVSANKMPHARMTTGNITKPNYNSTKGNSLRTAYIADFQHIMGGLIVEIEDDNIFHHTQVEFDADGSFRHLGYRYDSRSKKRDVPVFVMGDLHAGDHDESALSTWQDIIKYTKSDEVILHDTFNGNSINHHAMHNVIKMAENAENQMSSLSDEVSVTAQVIDRILSPSHIKKGVVVASNHDDFIDRYLQRGGFINDPVNFRIGCLLAANTVNTNKNVLCEAFNLIQKPKSFDKLVFLSTEDDYLIGGVNLGHHGDKGPSGTRGSIRSLSRALSKAVIAHSHTPGKYKHITQIGTTSKLRLGYNKGPSSWVHCSALVYRNGQVQLINSIFGKTFTAIPRAA